MELGIGNDDNDQNINIGTDGVRTIAIGTASGTGSDPSTAINLNAVTVTLDATTGNKFRCKVQLLISLLVEVR